MDTLLSAWPQDCPGRPFREERTKCVSVIAAPSRITPAKHPNSHSFRPWGLIEGLPTVMEFSETFWSPRNSLEAFWRLSGDSLEALWKLSGDSQWKLVGNSLETFWRLSGGSLETSCRFSGDSLEILWRLSATADGLLTYLRSYTSDVRICLPCAPRARG